MTLSRKWAVREAVGVGAGGGTRPNASQANCLLLMFLSFYSQAFEGICSGSRSFLCISLLVSTALKSQQRAGGHYTSIITQHLLLGRGAHTSLVAEAAAKDTPTRGQLRRVKRRTEPWSLPNCCGRQTLLALLEGMVPMDRPGTHLYYCCITESTRGDGALWPPDAGRLGTRGDGARLKLRSQKWRIC